MKRCILEVNHMVVIETVYHFVDSNLRVEIFSKMRGYQIKSGVGCFGSCSPWEGGNHLPWGRKRLPGGPGVGRNMQINHKMNLIQDSCQRFFLHFKNTFDWLLQVYCITQRVNFSTINFSLDQSSVSWGNSSLLFYLELYMLWTKRAHQSANFQTCECSHEN